MLRASHSESYANVTPGAKFEIWLTLEQNDRRRIAGYASRENKDIEMDLCVDGVIPGPRGYQLSNASPIGSEIVVPGFRDLAVFRQGSTLANQVLCPFVFGRVIAVEKSKFRGRRIWMDPTEILYRKGSLI